MKKSISLIVLFVLLLVGLVSIPLAANASVNVPLCSEDGAEMRWGSWYGTPEYLYYYYEEGEYNGRPAQYIIHVQRRIKYTGYICTQNSSHKEVFEQEIETYKTREFMGYL